MFSLSRTKFSNTLVLLAILLATVAISLANKQCKSTVMKIVMRQCSRAGIRSTRHERGHSRPEIQSNIEDVHHGAHADDEELPGRKIQRSLSTGKEQFRYESSMRRTRRKRIAEIFQQEETCSPIVENDEGMSSSDLTVDEIDQLYSKIVLAGRRSVRDAHETPENAKNLFLKIAARCCQNEEMCLSENIVSCV